MIPREMQAVRIDPHPHLVILGAGASYAATPEGELLGRRLPLMNQLPEAIELRRLLDSAELKLATSDFETYFDSLAQSGRLDLCRQIEDRLFAYFDSIQIANHATLYDRLVLALRRKDAIATFNWDPLLPYAYRRHGFMRILPALLFLHGNVKLGVCHEHKRLGWRDDRCDTCKGPMEKVRLLFPVGRKDYSSDPMIAEQWNHLDWYLQTSYFVTIVGYSAPATDVDARTRIIEKLRSNDLLDLLQVEIVDPNAKALMKASLNRIAAKTHCDPCFPLSNSWLFRHPRLSCEALFQATMMVKPIPSYSQPDSDNLQSLRDWAAEMNAANPEFAKEGQEWQG